MENIPSLVSLFSEAAFPIAVAAFLLIQTTRQLATIHKLLARVLLMLTIIMEYNGLSVPDSRLKELASLILKDHEEDG